MSSGSIDNVNEEWLYRLEIQERALEVISRELQENIGQLLWLARLQLGLLSDNLEHTQQEKAQDTGKILYQVIQDLKALARQNIPGEVINKGFIHAIRNEIQIKQLLHRSEVKLVITGEPPLVSSTSGLLIFCTVQDIINDNFNSQERPDAIHIECEEKNICFKLTKSTGQQPIRISENARQKMEQMNGKLELVEEAEGNTLLLSIQL